MANAKPRHPRSKPFTEPTPYDTIDRNFRAGRTARTTTGRRAADPEQIAQPVPQDHSYDPVRDHTTVYFDDPYASSITYGPALKTQTKRRHKTRRSSTQKLWDKARASAVTPWLLAWASFWYLTLQLPFAIISTAGLGMAAAVYAAISATVGDGAAKFLAENAPLAFNTFAQAIAFVAGSEFQIAFDPMLLFIVPFVVAMMLGFLNLLVIWLGYSIAGLNPLSGQASTAKVCLFGLALVGIAIPVVNLLPFTSLWCLLVWWKPK